MHKKPTHLAGGAPRPIRKYRMTIAHRAAPLDPLDESLSTTAVAAGTPAVGRWPSCRQLASVIRLPVSIHLVLSLTCSCAGHPTRHRIPKNKH